MHLVLVKQRLSHEASESMSLKRSIVSPPASPHLTSMKTSRPASLLPGPALHWFGSTVVVVVVVVVVVIVVVVVVDTVVVVVVVVVVGRSVSYTLFLLELGA